MIKKKTIEDHLANKPQWVIDLFKKIKARILKLNKVEEKVTNPYIGYKFKIDNKKPRLFVEVHPRNTKIELHLRSIEYKNITDIIITEAPETHKWTLTKLVDVNSESNINSITDLITQSYNDVLEF